MFGALFTSVTGMTALSEQMSVIGNNIVNAETTGYKSNQVYFSDLLNGSLSSATTDTVGGGVLVQKVSELWDQGGVSSTDNATDLAITGSGMFVVSDMDTGDRYYTRDGSFYFDADGYLVNSSQMVVQGYPIDESGQIGALGDIVINGDYSPPSATTEFSTVLNLNSGAEENDTFSTTTGIYDSLGNEIPLTITYTKSAAANEWTWEAEIPSEYGSVTGGGSGTLTFDENGALTTGTDPSITLGLTNGATAQTVSWDLYGDSGAGNGNLTQYAGESTLISQSQDGYGPGELSAISIDENGVFFATYSNGVSRDLFQLVLADFSNYDGLSKTDGNMYLATRQSGAAVLGYPGLGGMGVVDSGALESSNVDLASEMAKLITSQSMYQSCARVFSVSSEILELTVNLK